MILVSKKFMTPRTPDVVVMQDKEGDYIYVNRLLYDTAVIFNYTSQGDVNRMDDAVLGNKLKAAVNKDVLSLMLDIYITAPEPINMLVSFMLIAEGISVPENLEGMDKKEFAYNLLDIITNSIDVRCYVKLPTQMRSNLTGIQHLAKTYKERTAHTAAMWFTGVETVCINDVRYFEQYEQPAVAQPIPVATTEHKPLAIPTGSLTTVPAAGKDSVEPTANTISEEEFAELQRMLAAEDEAFEEQMAQQTKVAEQPKQVEVSPETKDRATVNGLFEDVLAGL